ncbi:MAG: HAD-IA family hydrolase [Planctomycetes bacterium]|nr:HAD-IA family hydrolase [Planctomycetota bacterium]
MERPSSSTSRCPACGLPSQVLWVHGHGQCEHCGTNTAPCCDGAANEAVPASAPPRAVLFDLDGTLIDSLADIARAANHVRERRGLAPLPPRAVAACVGDGATELVRRVLETPYLDDLELRDEVRSYRQFYEEHPVVETQLYPGIRELIEDLRADGRALAVVTNKPEEISRRILRALELERPFGALIGGDSAAERKPSALPIRLALERIGAEAREAWMIGDGAQDVRAARAAGVVACAVGWGFGDRAALAEAKPERRVSDVAGLRRLLGLSRR